MYSTTTSQYNLAIGTYALEDANRTADTDGYNVALGYNSGNTGTNDITTGNKNTLLGSSTAASAAAGTNQTVIGYGASGKGDNTVTIGNGDITLWSASDDGEVDLGSSSVEFKDLYIDGTANLDAVDIDGAVDMATTLSVTGNVTLANPTTETVGQSGFITFIQDGTGSRTVSLGTDYETAGGAGLTLTSTASATDIVPYVVVASGRILLGTPQLAFA